ncbi:Squalene monooxygenase [Oopsacas minuta]|uniref:Squalene monooxygenase n=1 Tax=Oopsacas minuta TaxID=111878 RepID=A0AAV7KI34_9METZ|nr:Squalene monooxygenase [Oopsacas minuta]
MEAEIAIIGSGIAGSAMAHVMGLQNRKVVLIERQFSEPDRIVGELLQPGGMTALQELQLEDCVENIEAAVVHGYVVHYMRNGESVVLTYPRKESGDSIHTGRAFHHGRFVMNLRKAALANTNVYKLEGSATQLIYEAGCVVGVSVKTKDSDSEVIIKAQLTVVADGSFSKFRRELSASEQKICSHFVGIIMEDCPQFKPNFAEVIISEAGVILVYKISPHCTRALIDIRGPIPSNLRSHILESFVNHVPQHIRAPFVRAVENGRLRSMPNCFLASQPKCIPGVILLGDASNQRHPLTGCGMTAAFNDVIIWRNLLQGIDLSDHSVVLSAVEKFHWERKSNHSYVINVLAQALYSLFSATEDNMKYLQEACFNYFQLGGECADGPIALLSVVTPKPLKLIGHFFTVAFYAMYNVTASHGLWMLPLGLIRSLRVIYTACKVIFPLMLSETLKPIKANY